jgi:oligopeptide transport system substrate-binding protein
MKLTKLLTAATVAAGVAFAAVPVQAVTLNLHNGGDPASLDPHRITGDWENRVVGDYIEGLMTEDAGANAIHGQAESHTVSDDGLVYTFTLRDDAVWSDGTPVTAHDFEFALNRIMDPATAAEYAYLQYPIKNAEAINGGAEDLELGVKAIDDKTLEITLENPTPYFLDALTHYTAYPVPKHLVEELGDDWTSMENIVANGPYKPVEWVPGSYVHSVKNDSYYGADDIQIDEVYYYVLEDQAAALNRYRAGEFDILTDFPADQFQWLQDNRPGEAHVAPFLGVYYYTLNHNFEPLKDIRVREALSIAINREVIGPEVLGTGEIAAYSWIPPGTSNYVDEGYMPDWASEPYADRVARATALMEEAGYSADNPLDIVLRYNTNDNHQRIAVAISAMWKPLHVNVELFNSEVAVHYNALDENDFEVGRAGWLMDYNDPINMLDLLKGGIPLNYGRYNNEEFNSLLDQSATELDLDARAELLHQATVIAMEDFATIPIYYYVSKNVVAPYIDGFEDNAKDVHRTRYLTKSE